MKYKIEQVVLSSVLLFLIYERIYGIMSKLVTVYFSRIDSVIIYLLVLFSLCGLLLYFLYRLAHYLYYKKRFKVIFLTLFIVFILLIATSAIQTIYEGYLLSTKLVEHANTFIKLKGFATSLFQIINIFIALVAGILLYKK